MKAAVLWLCYLHKVSTDTCSQCDWIRIPVYHMCLTHKQPYVFTQDKIAMCGLCTTCCISSNKDVRQISSCHWDECQSDRSYIKKHPSIHTPSRLHFSISVLLDSNCKAPDMQVIFLILCIYVSFLSFTCYFTIFCVIFSKFCNLCLFFELWTWEIFCKVIAIHTCNFRLQSVH